MRTSNRRCACLVCRGRRRLGARGRGLGAVVPEWAAVRRTARAQSRVRTRNGPVRESRDDRSARRRQGAPPGSVVKAARSGAAAAVWRRATASYQRRLGPADALPRRVPRRGPPGRHAPGAAEGRGGPRRTPGRRSCVHCVHSPAAKSRSASAARQSMASCLAEQARQAGARGSDCRRDHGGPLARAVSTHNDRCTVLIPLATRPRSQVLAFTPRRALLRWPVSSSAAARRHGRPRAARVQPAPRSGGPGSSPRVSTTPG